MRKLVVVLCALLIVGCAGGTVGGLFPAPKILKGKLNGTRYTSPNSEFSVTAPVSEKGSEWLYTEVRETDNTYNGVKGTEVQFKTPYDSNFYSTVVYSYPQDRKADSPKIFFPQLVESSTKRFSEFGAEPEIVISKELELAGRRGLYGAIRMNFVAQGRKIDKAYAMYSFCENQKCAVVVAELNSIDGIREIPPELFTGSWPRFNDFAKSLELSP